MKKNNLVQIEIWADKAKLTDFSELLRLASEGAEDLTGNYKIYRVIYGNFNEIKSDSVLYIAKNVQDIKNVYGPRNLEYLIDFEDFANNYAFDDDLYVAKSLNHEKGY